jgi:hypothetical protein
VPRNHHGERRIEGAIKTRANENVRRGEQRTHALAARKQEAGWESIGDMVP